MPDQKYATIQYRYVNVHELWDGFILKDMVTNILNGPARAHPERRLFEDVSARKIDLDQDGTYVVLNKMSDPNSWDGPFFFGQLIHVKDGGDVPGIDGDLNQVIPAFDLRNINIGDRAKIVEGVLYFAISANHVALIEGQRTKARTLERYLTKLLQEAGELEPGNTIILPAKLELGQPGVTEVQELNIQPLVIAADPEGHREEIRRAAEVHREGKTVIDLLKYLGWSEEDIANLQASLPEGGWIEGSLKVFFKRNKNRRAAINREDLETALRNLDPYSLQIMGADGTKESGGLVKLSKRVKIPIIGDLLDPEEAMSAIEAAMREWALSGKIDCDFEP